jgi:hypothetical protein
VRAKRRRLRAACSHDCQPETQLGAQRGSKVPSSACLVRGGTRLAVPHQAARLTNKGAGSCDPGFVLRARAAAPIRPVMNRKLAALEVVLMLGAAGLACAAIASGHED